MTLEHFKLPRDDWYDITNWDYRDKEVYDPSKFTVVGNPTITDDGVASGFRNMNYLKYPNFDTSKPWNVSFKFNCNKYDVIQGLIRLNVKTSACVMVRPSGEIFFRNHFMSSTMDLKSNANLIQLNTDYICDIGWTGTMYYLKINNNLISSKDSIEVTILDETYLGIGQAGYYSTTSSIDLKSFSITVDGEEVFKGTKTVQEKVPPKGEIVGRLYKEALIENFNAIEAKLNELSGLTAYETQVPDFSNYNYEDVTLDSSNNKVVNLQSFLKIMNLIGVPIECRFTGKLCNKVTYYDKNMRYHTIVNQKLDDLGTGGKVYIVLDSSNDTVSAVSDITDLTNKFLLGVYDNGRVYNLRSTGLVDINVLTHLCDMSVEPFFIGSLNGTKKTEGIYRNGRIVGAWGRESKGAYPKDITLFDIGRQ